MVYIPSSIRKCGFAILLSASTLAMSGSAFAQSGVSASDQYANVLQRIADQRLIIAQKEAQVERQDQQIDFLRGQITAVPEISQGVDEVIDKMAEQTENAINSDLPFLRDERLARVDKLKEDIASEDVPIGQKYRLALNALKIEVDYGFGVESYDGERPLNDGEPVVLVVETKEVEDADGNKSMEIVKRPDGTVSEVPEFGSFLRYGRMSLVYLNDAAAFARRYDTQSKAWVDVSDKDLNDIRRAVRISKGETAPAVVTAPVYKAD